MANRTVSLAKMLSNVTREEVALAVEIADTFRPNGNGKAKRAYKRQAKSVEAVEAAPKKRGRPRKVQIVPDSPEAQE